MQITKKQKVTPPPKKETPRWEIYYRPAAHGGKMSMYPVIAETPEEALEKFRSWAKGIGAYYNPGVEYWLCPNPVKSGVLRESGDTEY